MKSKLLLTSMTTILGLYGVLIFFLLIVFNIAGWSLSYLLVISILVLVIQFLIAPPLMDLVMKWFYGVKFDVNMPDYLKDYVQSVCQKNNIKYPKIGYIKDGSPNAFTYGRTKNDARIILTQGIFDMLSKEEVKTVVSHELGHAVHYDMFLMTAVQIVPLILYYIYDATISSSSSSDDDNGKAALIGLVAYVLYIVSEYVILWFSRTREYYADEFAIESTANPNALASALVKIGYGLTTAKNKEEEKNAENGKTKKKTAKKSHISSVSALGIFDAKASKSFVVSSYDDGNISKANIKKAARWELWNPWAKWYEFNSTHPLISKRIKAICKYSNKYNQEQYIVFDEQQPESYVDDFAFEIFIKFLPFTVILTLAIIGILGANIIPNYGLFIGICIVAFAISTLVPYSISHKNSNYKKTNVADLLGEVKVSGVTSVPCIVNGEIIGRGNPGYIFSEDFVIRDETGIIFLDYNQPLALINTLFALLKSKKYINKTAEIKGWYRRCPVPYIEIYTMTVDGKTKKCYSYGFTKGLIYTLIAIGVVISIFSII